MKIEIVVALIAFAGALLGGLAAPLLARLFRRRDRIREQREAWGARALESFNRYVNELDDEEVERINAACDGDSFITAPSGELLILDANRPNRVQWWLDSRARVLDQWWRLYIIRIRKRNRAGVPSTDESQTYRQRVDSTGRIMSRWARVSPFMPSFYFRWLERRDREWMDRASETHAAFLKNVPVPTKSLNDHANFPGRLS